MAAEKLRPPQLSLLWRLNEQFNERQLSKSRLFLERAHFHAKVSIHFLTWYLSNSVSCLGPAHRTSKLSGPMVASSNVTLYGRQGTVRYCAVVG